MVVRAQSRAVIHVRLWQLSCAVVCEVMRSAFRDTGNLANSTEVKIFTKEISRIAVVWALFNPDHLMNLFPNLNVTG